VFDVHEVLDNVTEVRPSGKIEKKITYQDSCHLSNAQGIRRQPRDLIKCIKGVEFVEMPGSEICCGAGGTYMITEPEMSDKVLSSKISNIRNMGVDIVATANPGCFMQLESGVKREGLNVEIKYVTDLLSEAYMKEK
jgi:glycolate oxidase iron-sulfur subunit